MKAITLWQPWATLVAIGVKPFETRSWPTRYRGPIAIHVGKTREGLDHCRGLPEIEEALAGGRRLYARDAAVGRCRLHGPSGRVPAHGTDRCR